MVLLQKVQVGGRLIVQDVNEGARGGHGCSQLNEQRAVLYFKYTSVSSIPCHHSLGFHTLPSGTLRCPLLARRRSCRYLPFGVDTTVRSPHTVFRGVL